MERFRIVSKSIIFIAIFFNNYNSFNASIKRWLSKVERTAIRIYSPFRKAFFVPQSFIKILYSFKSNSVNSLEEYLLITSHKNSLLVKV